MRCSKPSTELRGPRVQLPGGSGVQVDAGTCGRDRGAGPKAESEGTLPLPEIGSEVLGTERGTLPDTGPLSTASISSRKGEARGGQGPRRGRVTKTGIVGSARSPGVRLATCERGRCATGLGPTRISSARFGLRLPD